jgi:hypothetical protein
MQEEAAHPPTTPAEAAARKQEEIRRIDEIMGLGTGKLPDRQGAFRRLFNEYVPEADKQAPAAQGGPGLFDRLFGKQKFGGEDPIGQALAVGSSIRINPAAWDRFIAAQPRSAHIEDRRGLGEPLGAPFSSKENRDAEDANTAELKKLT